MIFLLDLRSNNKASLTQFFKHKLSLSKARSDILYAVNIMLHQNNFKTPTILIPNLVLLGI